MGFLNKIGISISYSYIQTELENSGRVILLALINGITIIENADIIHNILTNQTGTSIHYSYRRRFLPNECKTMKAHVKMLSIEWNTTMQLNNVKSSL